MPTGTGEFTRELAGSDLAGKLPEAVGELITSPPPVSSWVPEVHAVTLFVGVRYVLMESDASFLEWAYKHNNRLLRGPLHAILFKLVSPERVLRGASERWGHFHRGIELMQSNATSFQFQGTWG